MTTLFGRFFARGRKLAKDLNRDTPSGVVAKINESPNGWSWEVADIDDEGRYTGMIYKVRVERSRWAADIVGKKRWEI